MATTKTIHLTALNRALDKARREITARIDRMDRLAAIKAARKEARK